METDNDKKQNQDEETLEAFLRSFREVTKGLAPLEIQLKREQAITVLRSRFNVSAPAKLVDAALSRASPENGTAATDAGDEHQGTVMSFEDPEPWPEPVKGADLLADLACTFARFLVLPQGAATALALWAVHSHTFEARQTNPVLAITSPVQRCGKTRVLDVLRALAPRPLPASNVTAATIFRVVEKWRPTLLVDEADTFLSRSDEMAGIINSGHTRSTAYVVRTVGDDHEPRTFSTWCCKAIAAINGTAVMKATTLDRSIIVRMRRKARSDKVERWRAGRSLKSLEPLQRKVARWAADNAQALREADPSPPDELHDRAADNWRPLLAIAEIAGGPWPERAHKAALVLTLNNPDDSELVGVQLLRDLRAIFDTLAGNEIFSADLAERLAEIDGSPWSDWRRGQPITQRALADLLKPFEIHPRRLRIGGVMKRGYTAEMFADAWARYLDDVTLSGRSVTEGVTLQKGQSVTEKSHETAVCDAVTLREGGALDKGGKGAACAGEWQGEPCPNQASDGSEFCAAHGGGGS